MKVSTLDSGAFPSPLKTPMEDRKRAIAADHDDGGPPSKRQATSANGGAIKMDPEKEKEVENYQKEAIIRQMREYKRERNYFESQVSDLMKRVSHHDANLRIVNTWFSATLDEVHTIIKELPVIEKDAPYPTALLVESGSIWEDALKDKATEIRAFVTDLQARAPAATPEVAALQEKVITLSAAEKAHHVEVARINSERDRMNERLEDAMYRYLVAEKKLDRAKSATVQKLEQSAVVKREDDSAKSGDKTAKVEKPTTNGEVDPVASAEAESARQVAVAAAEKRRDQVDQLEVENRKLAEQLTAAKTRAASVTDDDFAKTGLFATSRSQMEDMIKRINDLKATNTQLQAEAKKLQAERMSFRTQVEDESRATVGENESQLARSEADLIRIRNIRDELTSEIAILKGGTQPGSDHSFQSVRELASAREARITALESELERARLQQGDSTTTSQTTMEEMGVEELKTKVQTLQSQYQLLSAELPSMETAWRKASALASKKVADMSSVEDQISRLQAEKAKADQKYFAAMRAKEAREGELRQEKMANARSGEIISALKDNEQAARAAVVGLEKQIAEAKDGLTRLETGNKSLQQKVDEGNITRSTLTSEVAELKKVLSSKDETSAGVANTKRELEVELAQATARLEDTKKQVATMKKNSAKVDAGEADDWRRLAICPVCNIHLRNTALKLCSHVFCNNCVQDLISHRSRKCPSCSKAFGTNDSMPIILA